MKHSRSISLSLHTFKARHSYPFSAFCDFVADNISQFFSQNLNALGRFNILFYGFGGVA